MDAIEIPGYDLEGKLGEGAMASVYLAREAKLDRLVALKVMSKRLLSDSSFADRFLREARIVASISHHNIVTVFDVGSFGDFHYMAMELLPGGNLGDKIKVGPSLEDAVAYVKDIAKGLHYAASKNFIHRDIKPDNIMFGEDGRAVITDFGIARSTEAENSMTIAGSVIGTPQYMSPEQAGGKDLDHRTDLYSLGIILYEMLAGKPPFRGSSAISTGVMHITKQAPPLPVKHAQFQNFIDKALAKDPSDRFQSGDEFITALSGISLKTKEEFSNATLEMNGDEVSDALSSNAFQSHKFDVGELCIEEEELTEDISSELSDEFLDINAQSPFSLKASDKSLADSRDDSSQTSVEEQSGNHSKQDSLNPKSTGFDLIDRENTQTINDAKIPTITPTIGGNKASKPRRSSSFPRKSAAIILFIIFIFGGHIIYVNILQKEIKFLTAATDLSNLMFSITGKQFNFISSAEMINNASVEFSGFVSNLIDTQSQAENHTIQLTLEQKRMVLSLDNAIQDRKLYSPKFDCAELYFNELIEIDPSSKVIAIKASELLEVSLEYALNLADQSFFDKAELIMEQSQNILMHIENPSLVSKHSQVWSTIKIMQ